MSRRAKNLQQRLADHLSDGGTDYEGRKLGALGKVED